MTAAALSRPGTIVAVLILIANLLLIVINSLPLLLRNPVAIILASLTMFWVSTLVVATSILHMHRLPVDRLMLLPLIAVITFASGRAWRTVSLAVGMLLVVVEWRHIAVVFTVILFVVVMSVATWISSHVLRLILVILLMIATVGAIAGLVRAHISLIATTRIVLVRAHAT